jgi:hypothetical protein
VPLILWFYKMANLTKGRKIFRTVIHEPSAHP